MKKIFSRLMSLLFRLPTFQKKIEKEFDQTIKGLEKSLKPYKNTTVSFTNLPSEGVTKEDILSEMEKIKALEEPKWKNGLASGSVYHGDEEHINFVNKVYSLNSQLNPLHPDIWPSATKYEAEIVAMTASMLKAPINCGVVTSGGTESILLAMKSYRDMARVLKRIKKPEIIAPVSAHAAFDKAAQYFNIKLRKIPLDENFKVQVSEVQRAINKRTIAIIGSAPTFPHGVIDPIEELSNLAFDHKVPFHTDACLGGFILPWAQNPPPFDFRLKGVTSISVDTHKYGYAPKGTSVILYRDPKLRHFQYFKTTEWPGGLYFSPTLAGSRPGALSAACWATMISLGLSGYMQAANKILTTGENIKKALEEMKEIKILGDPLWNIAFTSPNLNIYKIMDFMSTQGWALNGLHKPPCIHLCLTLRHTLPGVEDKFISDLKLACEHVKKFPKEKGDMAPIYGLAATTVHRQLVSDLLTKYIDFLYEK